jgi:hypothetical protein
MHKLRLAWKLLPKRAESSTKEGSYVFGTCKDRSAADDLFSSMRRNAFSILGSRNALPVRHLPATGTPILEPSRTVA